MSRTKDDLGWSPGGGGRNEWRDASSHRRCPVCGSDSWCQVHRTDPVVLCKRVESAHRKTNRDGIDFYIHHLDGYVAPSWREDFGPTTGLSADRAPTDVLDTVYRILLASLSLSDAHHTSLLKRGLGPKDIDAGLYRSLPVEGRSHLAERLIERVGEITAATIPGLIVRQKDGRSWWSLAGSAGLIVPVIDATGQVVALKVRRDEPGQGNRYTYVSSAPKGGASALQSVHVPPGTRTETIRITEGELKAAVCTAVTDVFTISVPGIGNWRDAPEILQALGAKRVLIAFDQDENPNTRVRVKRQRDRLARALARIFGAENVGVETWPVEAGKGLDDLLAACRSADVETHWNTVSTQREPPGIRRSRKEFEEIPSAQCLSSDEAVALTAATIRSWQPGAVKIIIGTPGGGKSRGIHTAAVEDPRRFIIGSLDYRQATQHVARAHAMGLSAEIREGRLRVMSERTDETGEHVPACLHHKEAQRWLDLGNSLAQDVCPVCPDEPGCPAKGEDGKSKLVSSVSIMVGPLKGQIDSKKDKEETGPCVPVFDECPSLVSFTTVTESEVNKFCRMLDAEFFSHRDALTVRRIIATAIDPWALVLRSALKNNATTGVGSTIDRLRTAVDALTKSPSYYRIHPAETTAKSRWQKVPDPPGYCLRIDPTKVAIFEQRAAQWGGDMLARIRAAAASALDVWGSWLQNPKTLLDPNTSQERFSEATQIAKKLAQAAVATDLEISELNEKRRQFEFLQPTPEGIFLRDSGACITDGTPPIEEVRFLRPDADIIELSVPDGVLGTVRVFRYDSCTSRKYLAPDGVIQWENFERLLRISLEEAEKAGVTKLLIGAFKVICDQLPTEEYESGSDQTRASLEAPQSILDLIKTWRLSRRIDFVALGVRGLDTWINFDGFASLGDHRLPVTEVTAMARRFGMDAHALAALGARRTSTQFHGRARDPQRETAAWHLHIGRHVPLGWHSGNAKFIQAPMGRPKTVPTMTAAEFVALGQALGWTVRLAAAVLGISRGIVGDYRTGRRAIPDDVAKRVRALKPLSAKVLKKPLSSSSISYRTFADTARDAEKQSNIDNLRTIPSSSSPQSPDTHDPVPIPPMAPPARPEGWPWEGDPIDDITLYFCDLHWPPDPTCFECGKRWDFDKNGICLGQRIQPRTAPAAVAALVSGPLGGGDE